MVHFGVTFPSTSRDTCGPTMACSTWSEPPPVCSNWSRSVPVCLNLSGPSVACSLYSRLSGLPLAAAALAQLSSATIVAAAVTDMLAVAVLSVVAAVLARDDPSSPSAGSIVALCLTQWQCLCLRRLFLRLGRLERGSPWLHGRRWPQAAWPRKRLAESPFISEVPDTCLCPAFLRILVPQ